MRLTSYSLLIVLGLFPTASVFGQDSTSGPLTRLVERFRPQQHSHTHSHTHTHAPAATAPVPAPQTVQYVEQPAQEAPQAVQYVEQPAQTQELPQAAQSVEPVQAAQPEHAAHCQCTGGDPYGFTGILNRVRASAGLHPVAYDPSLSSWASQNNAEQCRLGLGHHVNPAGVQNCAWNYPDANATVEGWMNSPGHRENMLSPAITHIGVAFGPGPYWTLNAR